MKPPSQRAACQIQRFQYSVRTQKGFGCMQRQKVSKRERWFFLDFSEIMAIGISDRAAVFLSTGDSAHVMLDPAALGTRLEVNPEVPLEFENEFFVGRVVILHRVPQDFHGTHRYREFFGRKKRRWELRWQGRFKQCVDDKIVFGAEITAGSSPRLNFASRAFLSILFKFAQSLARNRGADLYTNMVSEMAEGTKFFYFPLHTSDLILSTPPEEIPPDICIASDLEETGAHVRCNQLLRDPSGIDLSNTYTFVFYSMYLDFISWDIQNVPIGLNGMSLNRLIGNQPVSVVMKKQVKGDEFFRLLLANRCTSPDWSSYFSTGDFRFNAASISEFFSVMSSFDSEEINGQSSSRRSAHHRTNRLNRSNHSVWSNIKRIFTAPGRYLSACLRAPVSFAVSSEVRKTPTSRAVIPTRKQAPPPISEEP